MYEKCFKRVIDFLLALVALLALSPLLMILIVSGAIVMRGNPFFTQMRPGRKDSNGQERIFRLIKFRTMTCEKDVNGHLLADEKRLTKYGNFLRSTSLDELPELVNILVGDMSIVGPRPLLVEYLDRYTEEQRHRHDVRPGLTGLAQVRGRNAIDWEEKFNYDVYYTNNITFVGDLKIIFETISAVLKRDGITSNTSATMEEFMGTKQEL